MKKDKNKSVRLESYIVKQIDKEYGTFSNFVQTKIRNDKSIKKRKK